MLKSTSLVSVIAVTDLLYSVQLVYNQNFKVMLLLLLVATIWYIVITSLLAIGQYFVERRSRPGPTRRPFAEHLLRRRASAPAPARDAAMSAGRSAA